MSNNNKQLVMKGPSRTMQVARRLGIVIEVTKPHLPITEQEQSDVL